MAGETHPIWYRFAGHIMVASPQRLGTLRTGIPVCHVKSAISVTNADVSLVAVIGGATNFFVGTDAAYLPDQNVLIDSGWNFLFEGSCQCSRDPRLLCCLFPRSILYPREDPPLHSRALFLFFNLIRFLLFVGHSRQERPRLVSSKV